MDKKIEIIDKFDSEEEYYNRYCFALNFKKNKFYSKEDLKKQKKGKFYKVKKDSYVKLPFYTKKIAIIALSIAAFLIVGGTGATVAVFYMPHKVTLNSKYLEIVGDKSCRLANDYRCTFKIKDEAIETQYMNNINIYSITSNGNTIPPLDYYFTYQTNAKNELVIPKRYLNGNIEINIDLEKRTQKHNSFFFGYYLNDYANFDDMEIIYPTKVGNKDALDDNATVDNILIKDDNVDIVKLYDGDEPLKLNYNAVIVREDNRIELKFHAKEGKTLPKNIGFKCNARFTKKGIDFTIDYSSDYKEATLKVPYYIVRDSGFIVENPDEPS